MTTLKVSVITPAFNAQDRITKIVEIVGLQRYSNVEHIVIDDGSSDHTAELLEGLMQKWPHLRALNQSNQGRSAARNRGVIESTADYLLFLDDDDMMDANAISEMVRVAAESPGAVVYTDWKVKLASDLTVRAKVNLHERTVFEIAATHCPFVIHGCLIPRLAMVEANGFDETLNYAEDWDLWQRLGRTGVPFVGLAKPLVTYNLSHRKLSSDNAHAEYLQGRLVIERGFDSDDRVASPLPEYRNGCTVGCPEEALISTLAWFAGIEYAQRADFPWISDYVTEIRLRSDYVPDSEGLASVFCAGMSHGRGLRGLDVAALKFHRLRELAAAFGLHDPSVLVPRLTFPTSFPRAVSEVQHCKVSLQTVTLPGNNGAGRVQPWMQIKDLYRRCPAGLYVSANQVTELKFNLIKGVALATLDRVSDRDIVRSLPARFLAIAKRRSIFNSGLRELAGSSVDRGLVGSILPNMELPAVKSPVKRYEKTPGSVVTDCELRPIDRNGLAPEIANQVPRLTLDKAEQLFTVELPVLTYHSIGARVPVASRQLQVSRSDFVDQLSWLQENGYRTPQSWEVSALVRRGRPIHGKAILITFDDAFQCVPDIAWPLLENYGFGAALFATTSFLGDAARMDSRCGKPMKFIDGSTLAELASAGLCVGSRTISGQPMTHVSTSKALEEMLQSKGELQSLIRQRVDLFAFPYGIFDPQLARLAKYCGYSLAFTVSGFNIKPFDNPFTLGRFIVDGSKPPLALFDRLPGHERTSAIRRSLNRSRKIVEESRLGLRLRNILNR